MTPRDDGDAQATRHRSVRRKEGRGRQAGRLLSRAGWLDAPLAFWTGERQAVPRLTDAFLPLRAVLQDRLADLPAGLYAVRVGFPESRVLPPDRHAPDSRQPDLPPAVGPLRLEITSVDLVTRERIAETARAIEAVARYPKAGTRFVASIDRWRRHAWTRLDESRRAVEGAAAWPASAPAALALEARALWLGAGLPPSSGLPDPVLSAWAARSPDPDPPATRLAAVELGRRHAQAACHAGNSDWAAAGRALTHWPAAAVAWAAAAIGPGALAALSAAAPALDDPLAATWAEERRIAGAATTPDEIVDLARLLQVVAATRGEPARRHAALGRLTVQALQSPGSWLPGQDPVSAREGTDQIRELALTHAYADVRSLAADCLHRVPGSLHDLVERWIGDEVLGWGRFAYVDHLLARAAATLGLPVRDSLYVDPTPDLLRSRAPGSALDPAGGTAVVTVANRLRWKGAAHASAALADWLEVCRPLVPLGTFWHDVLAIVPSSDMPFDADRARLLVESSSCHGPRIATELALGPGLPGADARTLLPAVLARGPIATERVFRRDLWLPDEDSLDAALTWMAAVERRPRAGGTDPSIPMPRRAFIVSDRAVRDALLSIGLHAWGESRADARQIECLVDALARAASRTGTDYLGAALPRLGSVAALLGDRVLRPGEGTAPRPERGDDAPFTALAILDVCARWLHAGFKDVARLARVLANRWRSPLQAGEEWDREDADRDELIVRLSEGRIPRFLSLLTHLPAPRRFPWRALEGWILVQAHPTARSWVSACLDRTELLARVVHLLERIALVMRLDPGTTAVRLFGRLDQSSGRVPGWPSWVPPDAVVMLDQVARASELAGLPAAVPGSVQRILDRSSALEQEREALRARIDRGTPTRAERARLDKLERFAADADARMAELRKDLCRALPKQLALVGLAAIESIVRHDLEQRWRRVLGGDCPSLDDPAWDNALHMLGSITRNRRALVRLLRHAARGDQGWARELPPNVAFLAGLEAAGLHPDEWLADRSLVVPGPRGPLTVYASSDPLEVLQMGSLFGTCLSAGRFNAHAAVAAAVEANKRVLYVKDAAGRVLGRQLLALTPAGELIGFTAYGAAADEPERHGAWVKLALELLALDMARASGARLKPGPEVSSGLDAAEEQSLMLFCRGYVDVPEPFDWWIETLAAEAPRSGEADRARLRTLLEGQLPTGRDARTRPAPERDALGWAACRALLWLGADAPALSAGQEQALGLSTRHRALLANAHAGTASPREPGAPRRPPGPS